MTQSAEGPLSRYDLVGCQLHVPRCSMPSIPGLLRPPLQLSPGNQVHSAAGLRSCMSLSLFLSVRPLFPRDSRMVVSIVDSCQPSEY